MKTCPHCSAVLEEESVRCVRCGKWVIQGREGKRPRKKRKADRKLLVLLGALILLGGAIWRIPVNEVVSRELLNLKPSPAATLKAMEADLHALRTMQTDYFQTHGSFAGSPSLLGFEASDGVTLSLIVTPTGWSAGATHRELGPDVGCAVYGGTASPPRSPVSPTAPGVVECTGEAA